MPDSSPARIAFHVDEIIAPAGRDTVVMGSPFKPLDGSIAAAFRVNFGIPDATDTGWSPLLAVIIDGSRRVLQVTDWTGGTGTKPGTGYVGASGLTGTLASAVDIRGSAGGNGTAAPLIISTSATSLTIGSGTKTFTTQAALGWTVGQWLIALNDATHYMVGQITAYSGTSLTLSVSGTDSLGSGSTFASWTLNVTGRRGLNGGTGNTGTTGAGYDGTSTTSLAIGSGAKALTLDGASPSYAYASGQRLRFISAASPSNWMEGTIARSGFVLTMTSDLSSGTGTFPAWTVAVAGEQGVQGVQGVASLGGFTADATVAKIVPGIPPVDATSPSASLNLADTFPVNGDTLTLAFTVGISTHANVFEWDDHDGVSGGNIAVQLTGGTQAEMVAALRTAINAEFDSVIFDVVAGGTGTILNLTSGYTGATVSIAVSGPGALTGSFSGTDAIDGTPETGTRSQVLMAAATGKIRYPVSLDAPIYSGTAWASSITVGWTNGTDVHIPWLMCVEPTTGIYTRQYWAAPAAELPALSSLVGLSLAMWTSNGAGVPQDETTGDDFTARVSGFTL